MLGKRHILVKSSLIELGGSSLPQIIASILVVESYWTNDNNNGLLKYTQWHKNYELQCAYMIQEIKLHLFRSDWDYKLFINYLQFGYG